MKRIIIALSACVLLGLTIVPAIAGEPDLKSADGIKKFWQEQDRSNGGSASQ